MTFPDILLLAAVACVLLAMREAVNLWRQLR